MPLIHCIGVITMTGTLSASPDALVWTVLVGEPPTTAFDALALLDFALDALHELSLPTSRRG
ncbi:hypothetical protein [Permianibacter aggregans]|uniref:Uncharacterized protein n=2 Tax=Permianibacter aggregans TaxID=1510150 RepID=A0A4R6V0G5_9GAMM|nr:hypothetical protein [Permianibacter aggregans]TDQ49484.1 hypothetical protein EV696_104190 [Permianibacter aggregans]